MKITSSKSNKSSFSLFQNKALSFFILAVFLTGCATIKSPLQKREPAPVPQPKVKRVPEVPQNDLDTYNTAMRVKDDLENPELRQFHLADQFYDAENYLVAANEFEKFLSHYPKSKHREEALFKLGDCYFRVKADKKATTLTSRFLARYAKSRYRALIDERLGLISFRKGNYPKALKTLRPVLATASDPDYVQHALAVSLDKVGLINEAFNYYYDLIVRNPARPFVALASQRIDELLEIEFESSDLEVFIISQKYPAITDRLLFVLGISYYQNESYPAAKKAFTQFTEKYRDHEKIPAATEWIKLCDDKLIPPPFTPLPLPPTIETKEEISTLELATAPRGTKEEVIRDTIVLFAPVSGRFAKYGQEIENGVRFALDDLLARGEKPLKLVVMDTEGDKYLARKLAEEAVATNRVLLGIGGLFSHTTKMIAQAFEKANIPLLSPTASETSFLYNTRNIFASAFTNRYQAESLAIYAINKLGFKKLAVLYPNDSLGVELANLFKAKVEELGGEITALEFFEPKAADFQDQIRRLKLKKPQVVFIPAKLPQVRLILPQFTFLQFQPLYFGSSDWYSQTLKQIPQRDLTQVVFPTAFFSASRRPVVKNFIDNYWDRYAIAPDTLAALAYDLTNLFVLEYKKGSQTRGTIRLSLTSIKNYEGITGEITEMRGGLAIKKAILIQYKSGHWQEVN